MAHACLPYQLAVSVIMVGIVMAGVGNHAAMAVRAVGTDATGSAAAAFSFMAPMFLLFTMVAVMALVMAGFRKPNHLLALAAMRLLGMVL